MDFEPIAYHMVFFTREEVIFDMQFEQLVQQQNGGCNQNR
jgi:hypothetical protein